MTEPKQQVELSLILPVYNEEECIQETLKEAHRVLAAMPLSFEIIAVDDGSTDQTTAILKDVSSRFHEMRVIRITPHSGQSAAMGAGFAEAGGRMIVLMDADGQNDPADIPRLVAELETCDVCCGYRVNRQDTASKRWGSRLANGVRNWALKDGIIDTGCALKVFKADLVRDLPMQWRGMHRFLPALVMMKGAVIRQVPVNHRVRQGGQSKYTNLGRLKETIGDLKAVRWMQKRHRNFQVELDL